MAAGVKNGRFTLSGVAATLDSLVGDVSTYDNITLMRVNGSVNVGNSGVTAVNGFPLIQGETSIFRGAIVGANFNLIGPGEVWFFGNATA